MTGCTIAINGDLPEPQPLFIRPNTTQFYEPQARDGIIRLSTGEDIELFCSGSFVAPFTGRRQLIATCALNNLFLVHDKTYAMSELRCSAQAYHVARRTTHRCGPAGNETHVEVGFAVSADRFLRIMDVCHNEQLHHTLYSHFLLVPANAGFQRSFPRPAFVNGDFFGGRPVDRLYSKVVQMQTIGRVLGESRIAEVFDEKKDIYLARGHLAAKADYIFGSQQRGTFYFVNVAPQWQKFNAGNWESVENGVRTMVADRNLRTEIYTGTWGVLRLADETGRQQPLFLDYDAQGRGVIPVPALYYKVVIDVVSRQGLVLVGVNNPHATAAQLSGEYRLCVDVASRINWLQWDRTNVQRGFSYACEVNDFVRTVRDLPLHVRASGLLV